MIDKSDVLRIFPGSKIVSEPEIPESDWLAIQEEAARWGWGENDEKWVERFEPSPDSSHCSYCVKSSARRIARGEPTPKWRRYGKIVERTWADGHSDLFCLFCGRKHVGTNGE
jgi:hypothetical protein